MVNIFTIGVYGFTEEEFFDTLIKAKIDTFCDIRRRRGVRGSKYAFVNSKRLQVKLKELGIYYVHYLELAPSNIVRDEQKKADKEIGAKKRLRDGLSQSFINAYKEECLKNFNLNHFLEILGTNAKNVVLFCVERDPKACHRSIAAEHLNSIWNNLKVVHL